jgi:hypothetical protein
LYGFLTSSMRATCAVHRILLDFITLIIIIGEACKLRNSSLCSLLFSFLPGGGKTKKKKL